MLENLEAVAFGRRLAELAGRVRHADVDFLWALAEFDRRELYLPLGFASLWAYCMDALHLREGATFRRIHAARLLQRCPELAEPLRDGRLCLSTLVELEAVLNRDNLEALVEQAAFRSKRDVEQLVAGLRRPRELPAETLRRAPPPQAPLAAPVSPAAPPPPLRLEPVSQDDWLLRARLSDRVKRKLERARELASHAIPSGAWESVLEAALDCYIAEQEKRRVARTDRPRAPRPSACARTIPADLRRAVWDRDGGRCTRRGLDGRLCGSRWQLEYDHIVPVERGGPSTPANLRLVCRNHNRLAAEQIYGKPHMDQFRRGPTSAGGTSMSSAEAPMRGP